MLFNLKLNKNVVGFRIWTHQNENLQCANPCPNIIPYGKKPCRAAVKQYFPNSISGMALRTVYTWVGVAIWDSHFFLAFLFHNFFSDCTYIRRGIKCGLKISVFFTDLYLTFNHLVIHSLWLSRFTYLLLLLTVRLSSFLSNAQHLQYKDRVFSH